MEPYKFSLISSPLIRQTTQQLYCPSSSCAPNSRNGSGRTTTSFYIQLPPAAVIYVSNCHHININCIKSAIAIITKFAVFCANYGNV